MSYPRGSRFVLSLVLLLGACGPNTFRTRGTVLNPLHDQAKDDAETPHPTPILVIQRKETRIQVSHTIVGPQNKPMALKMLGEFCEIVVDKATKGRLIFQCLLFTNYRDELAEMQHTYVLTLPDGRKIPGTLHMKYPVQDHTVTISGAHIQPYQVVKDRARKTVTVNSYVQEVDNEFPLFSRAFKVIFEEGNLLSIDTPYVILEINGYQRRWIYRFDFTLDPAKAMQWMVEHLPRR